jgi:UDP:flavonoid glycosyltransferase YjiC (YdhE family)
MHHACILDFMQSSFLFPSAPSGPPTNVSVSSPSESTIVVEWRAPELLKQNGPINGYVITLIYSNGTKSVYSTLGSMNVYGIEGE